MVSETDKEIIKNLALKYKVARIFLFGSSLDKSEARDIDLAVEGIDHSLFFKFYGDLIFNLSKPVDLICLHDKSRLRDIILSEGFLLYG